MYIFGNLAEAVKDAVERAMGGTLSDILIQIVATIILVIVVKVFFWSRITEFIEKRKALVAKELDDAKSANEQAQSFQEETEKAYQDIKNKSKTLIEKAKLKGEEERVQIVDKAKREADYVMTQAQSEIELEKKKARETIKKEAVELAALMATKIIEKEIDEKAYQDLAMTKLESSDQS